VRRFSSIFNATNAPVTLRH